jgi:hypothetical protein
LKKNKFIEKFKSKSKTELKYKVDNPSLFDSEAVLAAKHILENFSDYKVVEISDEKQVEKPFIEPIFKEKAFFKNKWIYRLALVSSLFMTVFYFWVFTVRENIDFLIWSIINFLFFIVLISRDKKTLPKLKLLSIISLCFIVYRYVTFYLTLEQNESFTFELKDVKFIAIFLFIILGGELMIEIRKVQTNK